MVLGERTPVAEQREIYARLMETYISLSLAAVDHSGFAFREEMIKMAAPYSKVGPWMSPRTPHLAAPHVARILGLEPPRQLRNDGLVDIY